MRIHHELIACGLAGHELVGTGAAHVRRADAAVVRESADGLRWHRCLRCDAWLPRPPPEHPTAEHPPDRAAIALPLRGRALRDRAVLRLIALSRLVHCAVLAALAAAVVLFAADRASLRAPVFRVLDAVQGGVGGRTGPTGTGVLPELARTFSASAATLTLVALVLAGYALLEGVEAVGLWRGRRWAEYLTFVATGLLLVPEVYELARTVTPLKLATLAVNLAVLAYLLLAKRLFGLRGGVRADAAGDGWAEFARAAPGTAAPAGRGDG